MGTNYFAISNQCKQCKRYDKIHLGKSSAGWRFTFQYNGGEFYKSIAEMKRWLKGKTIKDECGEKISKKLFWTFIENKQKDGKTAFKLDIDCFQIDGFDFYNSEFS